VIIINYSNNLYVFWVKTGQEQKAAREIKTILKDDVSQLELLIETFFKKQGLVKKDVKPAFPGYIFFQSEIDNDDFVIKSRTCRYNSNVIIGLLRYKNTFQAVMQENEREAIEYLWQGKKYLENSVGYFKGDHVVISKGPLAGRESVIKTINRHKRQAVIEIEFMGGSRQITVGLEIIDRL
jgi:transcriptional antiterminator NusG